MTVTRHHLRFRRADQHCMGCGHRIMPDMPAEAQHWPECPQLRSIQQGQIARVPVVVRHEESPAEVPAEPAAQPRPAAQLLAQTAEPDLINLQTQVRHGLKVRNPERVFVLAPPVTLATVRITRPAEPNRFAERNDVTQHPLKLAETTELIPAEWLQEGDIIQVERR